MLRSILEGNGYTVMVAADGRAGLAQLRHAPSDLVLTDIFMPEQDGIEVILQLSRIWPQAKIIAMTGGGSRTSGLMSTIAPAAVLLGAQRTLVKPFTKQALLAAISAVLSLKGDEQESRARTVASLKEVL